VTKKSVLHALLRRRRTKARPIQWEDYVAIRQLVQDMQDAQNTKNGELFASAFAREHDYIAINGMFLPNQSRQDNARIHQRLYDESTSSVAGEYGEVEVRLEVSKIRFLIPGVVVVHVRSEFRLKGDPDKKTKNIITAVMQKQQGKWEIVAFHNAPVQRREEDETGFVIRMEVLNQDTKTQAKERKGAGMIKDVPLVGLFVNDQEAALDFYTNKLGLEKVQDEPYGESGARWITVSPAKMRIRIVLKKAEKEHEKAIVGRSDGAPILTLGTDDIYAAYERLRERGVRFLGEPYRYPWGIGALFLDQDGSPILLQQESRGRPARLS
jgi:uncharacterized protein (TIGR02246 family)